MYKKILFAIAFVLSVITSVCVYKYFFKNWTSYYQEKLYKEPRPLLIKALSLYNTKPNNKALDLGAGVGNDTAYLLKHQWYVWANDREPIALDIINTRTDIQKYHDHLLLLPGNFAHLQWNIMPQFDLIYAGYSLFFSHPKDFMNLWQNIENALISGGLFVGHFLAPDHGGFNWWQKRKMTLLTKEQLLNLLHNSNFTIEYFQESNEVNSNGIYDHGFDIIVRKRN